MNFASPNIVYMHLGLFKVQAYDLDEPEKVQMQTITPIILAGGSGVRLWPLSRKNYPKQFVRFNDGNTLFQQSILRLQTSTNLSFDPIITVSNSDFRFVVAEQFLELDIEPSSILLEPEGRNTAPAIFASILMAVKHQPDAVLLVCPSDHYIKDIDAFHEAINVGLPAVDEGQIVTFAVKPERAETGYGYVHLPDMNTKTASPVNAFTEKPNIEVAEEMLADGQYFWNAGIFLFKAGDMRKLFEKHCPQLMAPVTAAIDQGRSDLDFFRLDEMPWKQCEAISIDYAVMEKAKNVSAVQLDAGWSDLGNWNSIWNQSEKDEHGVVADSKTIAIDCNDSILRSDQNGQQVVGLGLDNIIAIAMRDAVLVADRNRAGEVGRVVDALKLKGLTQSENFLWAHRPWGSFEVLAEGEDFKVKCIKVKPSGVLSLQHHEHRSEHWVIVQGTATVTIGENQRQLREGQSAYVPAGTVHRLENKTEKTVLIIEVQIGSYLGEDDIVRLEDVYSRK